MTGPEVELSKLPGRRKKDLSLQSMIAPWSGEEGSIPVGDFLNGLELVAATGGWEESDKALVLRMRLRGQAAAFLTSRRELQRLDTSYKDIEKALLHRFQDTSRPEDYLLQLHTLRQEQRESAKVLEIDALPWEKRQSTYRAPT